MTHAGMLQCLIAILTAANLAAFAEPGHAQPAADIDALRTDVETPRRTIGSLTVSAGGSPVLGAADAPVTIVEFSDYECPFCRRHALITLPGLKAEYVDSGKVRYVYRDLPLNSHPQARKAAEAARCAGDQGKYWEMHDALFAKRQLLQEQLEEHAISLGLDRVTFVACLDGGKHAKAVRDDEMEIRGAGITKTPTFFIGRTRSGGMIEGVPMIGALPLATFRRAIDQLLETKAGL